MIERPYGYDRDEACVIMAKSIMNGENPYEKKTSIGNPITTGISGVIAIPFVLLFDDIKLLSFIFWITVIINVYKKINERQFIIFSFFFTLSWLPFKYMVYKIDEFLFPVVILFMGWYPKTFLTVFLLSRNWFNLLPSYPFMNIQFYILIVPLIVLAYYIHKGDWERVKRWVIMR